LIKSRSNSIVLVLAALALMLVDGGAQVAQAGNVYWDGADGLWQDANNWDGDAVPVDTDVVYIDNGGTVRIDANTGKVPAGGMLNDSWSGGLVDGTVIQTGSSSYAYFANWAVGVGATGGTYTIDAGTLRVKNQLQVSRGGTSYDAVSGITQTGGSVIPDKLSVGNCSTFSTSYYNLEGGNLNVRWNLNIATSSDANSRTMFTQSGGEFNSYRQMEIGQGAGTEGWAIYDLTGGEFIMRNEQSSGGIAPFVFTQPGGDVYVNIAGGTLKVQGEWDFTTFTGIADSDFRSYGLAATMDNLLFEPITLYGLDYTEITAIEVTTLVGDADGNGVVNAADYMAPKRNMGTPSGAKLADGDFNTTGTVDYDDLQLLIGNYGATGASSPVPEPATLFVLLAAGLPALLKRRRSPS